MADANWQRAGRKSAPKPKPLSPLRQKRPGQVHYGQTDRSPEEVKALLARYGPQRPAPELTVVGQDTVTT